MVMLYWGEQYFEGVFTGYLGANFTSGLITECQIAIIKENISHYCDATIEHPQLSHQEKEEQKRQMKQSLEVYIQGVKNERRGKGRMKVKYKRLQPYSRFTLSSLMSMARARKEYE